MVQLKRNKKSVSLSQPAIDTQEQQAVASVLDSGIIAQGRNIVSFEKSFASKCQAKEAVAVSSGTAALHVALLAHRVGPGDEVITTPFTFIATIHAIIITGATPVLVDIEEDTFNIDPSKIKSAITSRTKVILPVHLFGHPCEMSQINNIARRHNLIVVEDAAQAIGAKYHNSVIGSNNTVCFSLYATKNITTGEGGMITTNNKKIADRCRMLRNHGMKSKNDFRCVGYNYRMTEIAAALGKQQLRKLASFNKLRKSNAEFYDHFIYSAVTPRVRPHNKHAWHQYTVLFTDRTKREKAYQLLNKNGIRASIYYDPPAHKLPYLRNMVRSEDIVIATDVARRVLALPIHPKVTKKELKYIAQLVNSV